MKELVQISTASAETPGAAAFTAAQIAAVLGKFPQAVRRWLKGVRPDGTRVERRKLAAVWAVESLPTVIQGELERMRSARGFRSIDELFAKPDVWKPEFPWNEVCGEHQAEALKLQRALLPIIEQRENSLLSEAELSEMGQRSYRAEFGKEIKLEHWRYLFDRTLERDRGYKQFHRPELFLPGNLRRAGPARAASAGDFELLGLSFGKIRDLQNPTANEIDAAWVEIVATYDEICQSEKPKRAKRRLLDFVWERAGFLAKSKNALRVSFDRKLKVWRDSQKDEAALLDGRSLKRGERRAPEIPQRDIDILAGHSVFNCGTRTAQAVRELGRLGERSGLSAQTVELINAPHKSKSHVNRRLFNLVHHDAKLIDPFPLGKKAIDDNTPSLERDYSRMRSMDMVTMDDFTMPVYMFVPDGKGWWILTRGQCLLSVDCRSLKIIGWSIQPERNYNALVIRTLMNQVCRQNGLPGGWYFENGMWKTAHVVKGPPREWKEGKSFLELKPGWSQLGVKFIHAKRARSKLAELVGGKLQNLMEGCLGYCGREERKDSPKITAQNKLAVEARRAEPFGLFYSFDAWNEEIARLIGRYNSDPQDGKILNGLSPDAAFQQYWPHDNPPAKFGPSCWHLLAHYVSERDVGVDGIKFKIGNERYVYRDENSSALRCKKVLAWFDPECPELLGVTDLNGRNPVLVQRALPVDFRAAQDTDGELGQRYQEELAKVAGHNSYPKARYHIIKANFEQTFRGNLVAPGTANVAETFEAGREQIQKREQEKARQASTTAKRAQKLGLRPSLVRPGDDEAARGLEMMLRAERAMDAGDPEAGKKQTVNYTLKPFGTAKRQYVDYLLNQLTEFRQAGASFGQNFTKPVNFDITRNIAESQLKCSVYDEGKFNDVCAYLKAKIDATILGKRNVKQGVTNHHEFEENPVQSEKGNKK